MFFLSAPALRKVRLAEQESVVAANTQTTKSGRGTHIRGSLVALLLIRLLEKCPTSCQLVDALRISDLPKPRQAGSLS
ncbi:MAG: hypothetical protein ACREA2_06250, partial [Blastocatellia bacterium]